jgi:hypothetical protein
MIVLRNHLTEAEFGIVLQPKAPLKRTYIFKLEETGIPHSVGIEMTIRTKAKVVKCDGDTATIAWRDLFSKTPKINVVEYQCSATMLLPFSDFHSLHCISERVIEINSNEYERYNNLLGGLSYDKDA